MLNKAIEIAARAHKDQEDKGGSPYILHPLRVMLRCQSDLEITCAVLHDVVEDSDITFDDLKNEGFTEEVIAVLHCLTKREGESYDDFIGRVLENETACRVKLADLADNMDITRIQDPTEEDRARIEKYRRASKRINEAIPSSH